MNKGILEKKSVVIQGEQRRIEDSIKRALASNHSKEYMQLAISDDCDIQEKGIAASLLNNVKKIADSAGNGTESTDFGPYVPMCSTLVTAWYPMFPLKDLICVETLDEPLWYLFFSQLKAGTTKAGQAMGDLVETPLGIRNIKGVYPTGEVFGEKIDYAAGGTYATAYAPLKVQSVNLNWLTKFHATTKVGSNTYNFGGKDYTIINGNNVDLMFNQAGSTDKISVNITDGSITFTGTGKKPAAEGDFIEMYYVWNIETADDSNIPAVEESIERIPVEAQPRVLSMKWSVFAEYMKKSQFGQDIRTDNVQRVLNLLYQYQVRYIIDDLCFNATGKVNGETPTITLPSSGVYNVDVTANLVMRELKKIANVIEINSGRVEGNRIVCGSNLKWFVESLPNTWFQPTPDANTGKYGFSGPREIGTFGTFKVYYDPKHAENECHMTYRGTEWYDGAYYMGEYMPAVASDAIQLGVKVRDAVCSMEAYFYHKPDCTIKFNVINQA